jgi:hypothetical protein
MWWNMFAGNDVAGNSILIMYVEIDICTILTK